MATFVFDEKTWAEMAKKRGLNIKPAEEGSLVEDEVGHVLGFWRRGCGVLAKDLEDYYHASLEYPNAF